MKVNECEQIILVDVDSTLIMHRPKWYPGCLTLDYYGIKKFAVPHEEHVDLLKSYRQRGFFIRVHSNNGWKWAKQVVEKLNLMDIVHEIETKPCKFMDDYQLEHNEVIGQRVYIPFKENV